MSNSIIKAISAFILSFVVLINSFGNLIGVGDIIPTQPAEEITTVVNTFDTEAAEEFIAFFNEETAKIVNNGTYSYNRNCSYTDPIDVGGATDTLNSIIHTISENDNLDSVVGGFLGIGTFVATSTEYFGSHDDYKLKATNLCIDDITSFSEENGVYTFTIENDTNPKKNGSSAFARLTNDFTTEESIKETIAQFTSVVTVKEFNGDYENITVEVTVENGKITTINYSYDFDAELTVKAAVVSVSGTAATETVAAYTNIEY